MALRRVQRVPIGIHVSPCTGRMLPVCHLLYRTDWSDGTTTTERGNTVTSLVHTVGRKKDSRTERPELEAVIQAAAILINRLTDACLYADEPLPRKKKRHGSAR